MTYICGILIGFLNQIFRILILHEIQKSFVQRNISTLLNFITSNPLKSHFIKVTIHIQPSKLKITIKSFKYQISTSVTYPKYQGDPHGLRVAFFPFSTPTDQETLKPYDMEIQGWRHFCLKLR